MKEITQAQYDTLIAKGLTPEQISHFANGGNARTLAATSPTPPAPAHRREDLLAAAIDVGFPMAGGIAGGIAGAPLGPLGVIGGSGFGAAGGEAYRQLARRALGYAAPETPQEAAGNIAAVGATDAALTAAGIPVFNAVKKIGPMGRAALRFIPGPWSKALSGASHLAEAASSRGAASAAPAAVEAAASAAETAAERVAAMKPLRANATAAARRIHRAELESAMRDAKFDAPTKKAFREALGHGEAPKPTANPRLRVVPEKSVPVVKGTAESRLPRSRVTPKAKPAARPSAGVPIEEAVAQLKKLGLEPIPAELKGAARTDAELAIETRLAELNLPPAAKTQVRSILMAEPPIPARFGNAFGTSSRIGAYGHGGD